MSQGLAVSNVINVQVNLSPNAVPTQNFSGKLTIGSSPVIDTSERLRKYTSVTDIANDFGTSAPEYLDALAYFAQQPKPANMYIGRWAQNQTSATLKGGVLSTTQQAMAVFNAVTSGKLNINIDGIAGALTGLNFSAATNLNGVAAILSGAMGGATCVWNAGYSRFEITANSVGISSKIGYAISPTGVNLAEMLGLTLTQASAPVNGIEPETALDAVAHLADISNDWYGLTFAAPLVLAADVLAVADFIEAAVPARMFGVTILNSQAVDATITTDLASQLKQAGYKKTFAQYSSTEPYATASLFGRMLTTDFDASKTMITLKFKQQPTITPETLRQSQADALTAKNCNVFVNYQNGAAILQEGVMCGGDYIDTIYGVDWLQNYLQTALFNHLYGNTSKTSQTDGGSDQLIAVAEHAMTQSEVNGLCAAGVWTGDGFGALKTGDALTKGYYIYMPKISTQSAANRAKRKTTTMQIAAKLAGAFHSVNVILNVNN